VNLQAILIALYVRERTGRGLQIQNSQLQSSMFTGLTRIAEALATGKAPAPMGTARPNIAPDQAFAAADGYVTVSAPNDRVWGRLCAALGRDDLAADPRFASNRDRVANRRALVPLLEDTFRAQPASHWAALLQQAGVPAGEYQKGPTLRESLLEDAQVEAEGLLTHLDSHWGPMVTASPMWRFDKTEARVGRPAPKFAEHQEEVLAELTGVSAGVR